MHYRRLAGSEAMPRATHPDRVGPADATRRERQKDLREIPANPPGRSRLVDVIRWFQLADSLHHRLISVAPPARSVRQACSLSTGFLSTSEATRVAILATRRVIPSFRNNPRVCCIRRVAPKQQ